MAALCGPPESSTEPSPGFKQVAASHLKARGSSSPVIGRTITGQTVTIDNVSTFTMHISTATNCKFLVNLTAMCNMTGPCGFQLTDSKLEDCELWFTGRSDTATIVVTGNSLNNTFLALKDLSLSGHRSSLKVGNNSLTRKTTMGRPLLLKTGVTAVDDPGGNWLVLYLSP